MSGESKQIDEDENGPENGGMKSGPCLIAGFHALSCTSPSYYNPYRGVNKNTLSVDMVRLSLTFKGDRGEWLSRKGARAIERDVAELEPIAADVRRFEGAGRAERGAILDSIAARCAGAARAARAAIEELGDRIRALMRPRKAQRTVGDVMREATEVARATKALSRNHVAPTNSRQRGQAR